MNPQTTNARGQFCARCGQQLPAAARFCRSCGAPVQAAANPAPGAAEAVTAWAAVPEEPESAWTESGTTADAADERQRRSPWLITAMIAAVVLVLGAGAYFGYGYLVDETGSDQVAAPSSPAQSAAAPSSSAPASTPSGPAKATASALPPSPSSSPGATPRPTATAGAPPAAPETTALPAGIPQH
ncbi:zinc ribbon domain-containing protein [Arthrobacter sp. ATA002]|uniref:zinc ribbon domain-containing protein n=1 Tax=Arthrobacter sp. ATA002 TaxID=2991715 RepID=UPI0022A7A810|nr:zinc ribbon domain-containing protein [Arthrobacter sp. ATA002]WAP51407.1 zinc ribbon domain-containing protein [Arthrobacter sp. ATA002]